MPCLIMLLILSVAADVKADVKVWRDAEGKVLSDKQSQQNMNGFSAILVLTTEPGWRENWHNQTDRLPVLAPVKQVAIGETVSILPFFVHHQVDPVKGVTLYCGTSITRPSGLYAFYQDDFECFSGAFNEAQILVSPALLNFTAEAGDELGVWTVKYRLTDSLSKQVLSLRRQFTLIEPTVNKE